MQLELSGAEIRQEIIKCAQSVAYLMNNYGYIQTPNMGRILFKTWDFQDECLDSFRNRRMTIVNKSRQIGLSTIVAGYILYRMLFYKDQHIIIMAIQEKTARQMFRKVMYMYKFLPSWLKLYAEVEKNKRTWVLANDSRLEVLPKGADATRSAALNLLVIDEAAHIPGMNEIWGASEPSLSTGGDVIALSTPNGAGDNWFYHQFLEGQRFWETEGAENLASSMAIPPFYPLEYDWQVRPDRVGTWKEDTIVRLRGDLRMFSQEYDCSFLGSSDTFIEPELLLQLQEGLVEPIEKEDYLHTWEAPRIGHEYIISADVALGTGKDFSTAEIITHRESKARQVAELEVKMPPDLFAQRLVELSDHYNGALIAVENNSIGAGVVSVLKRILLERGKITQMYFEVKDQYKGWVPWYYAADFGDWQFEELYEQNKIRLGYRTDMKSRQRNLLEMGRKLRDGTAVVRSKRLHSQFLNYRHNNFRRPDHAHGSNDDLIMAWAIGLSVLEERAPFMNNEGVTDLMALADCGFSVDSARKLTPEHGPNFWTDEGKRW